MALLYLRSPDAGPVDGVFVDRCIHVEEVPLAVPDASAVSWRSRARWTLGLLRGLPPWAFDCRSDAFRERLASLAADWQPDVVEMHLVVMAQYHQALADCKAARILVDYDPPSAWAAELVREARGLRRLARRVELAAWRGYERRTRRRFDAIVVFAERDRTAISATAPGVQTVTIPLAFDIPPTALDPLGSSPPTVLFVGAFGHPPNVDAARWLAGSIFPRVLEHVPDAQLQLVGDRPGSEVLRLAGDAVAVYGSVPDVTPYLDRAAVVVAPIRLGGSMRGKVLEALAAGKALVATPRAAEGLEAVPGEHFLLASGEAELVDAIAHLLVDSPRRADLARRARAWASENLSWDRSVHQFERLYAALLRSDDAVSSVAAAPPARAAVPPSPPSREERRSRPSP